MAPAGAATKLEGEYIGSEAVYECARQVLHRPPYHHPENGEQDELRGGGEVASVAAASG